MDAFLTHISFIDNRAHRSAKSEGPASTTGIKVLKLFGLINGEWRRLHNEELHSLYRSPNIARVID